jgi:hypothetical protein
VSSCPAIAAPEIVGGVVFVGATGGAGAELVNTRPSTSNESPGTACRWNTYRSSSRPVSAAV